MKRLHQVLLIGTFLPLCWLAMMVVHELGHVFGAAATIAASVLFLRPAVIGSLRRHVKDKTMLNRLLNRFAGKERLAIHAGNSRVSALPASERLEIMQRLKSIAHR